MNTLSSTILRPCSILYVCWGGPALASVGRTNRFSSPHSLDKAPLGHMLAMLAMPIMAWQVLEAVAAL